MSFKGKVFYYLLKYRHILKGNLKREIVDFNTSIEKLRTDCDETAARLVKIPPEITIKEEANFKQFYAEWVIPNNAKSEKIVLYFHGGGFVMGNAKSHRGIVSGFSKFVGYKSLVFDYSLAPEFSGTRAVEDCTQIYKWLLDNGYKACNIAFVGDSAGGGIELGTILKLKDENIELPSCCVAFSPCTDATLSGESYKTRFKTDPCTPPGSSETYLSYYVGDEDPKNCYVSPLFGDLSNLPPTMIQVGNEDVLLDDSTRFAKRAHESGSDVYIKVWKGMFHCFPLLAPRFKEASKAMEEVKEFLDKYLG